MKLWKAKQCSLVKESNAAVSATLASKTDNNNGWPIFWAFVAFFGVTFAVNGYFITVALGTHTGVIAEHTYERGLAYDEALAEARAQGDIQASAYFEDGLLSLMLRDVDGQAIKDAQVSARFVRTVHAGYDFDAPLQASLVGGVYTVRPEMPLEGMWTVRLEAQWTDTHSQQPRTYHSELPILVR